MESQTEATRQQDKNDLPNRARALTTSKRTEILMSIAEKDLHHHLKELFLSMEPDYLVEVTHGPSERGKDLVIVKQDKIASLVIGVVVKCGAIHAKTLGEVDELSARVEEVFPKQTPRKLQEIESQIRQAQANPAEMPAVFKKLPIDKVYVVIAGQVSNAARTRLENEVQGKGEILDIQWLVNNFTDFYPQVFFEGKTMDFIQSQIQHLETKNWLHKGDKNLSEYFIEPDIRYLGIQTGLSIETLAQEFRQRKPFGTLRRLIASRKKVVLIGDPGTGKSAAIAKLAIDSLQTAYNHISIDEQKNRLIEVPIYASAQQILNVSDVNELIQIFCDNDDIQHRFKVNALLVDGLDETPLDKRQIVIEKSSLFANELDCALLIGSRRIASVETISESFERYELMPFQMRAAIKMFERLLDKKDKLEALREGLDKIKFQIPIIPLSLVLLLEVVEEHQEVPASVTELYERFINIILGMEDKKKGIEVLFEYRIKKRFLADLAYSEFLSKERFEIPRSDFDKFTEDYIKEYGFDRESLSVFLTEIERAGILSLRDNVKFLHRSIMDFFAAYHLFQTREEIENLNSFLTEIYFNESWGDTVFFFVGLKTDITKTLLKRILDFEGEALTDNISKYMIGRLLQAGWHSSSATKYYGLSKALRLAPTIRNEFLELTNDSRDKAPGILAEFLIMMLSDEAYRSGFLQNELRLVYEELKNEVSFESLSIQLPVLWAMRPVLSAGELRSEVNRCLSLISNINQISKIPVEDEARTLLFLMILEKGDKDATRAIQKKLNGLSSKHPKVMKELLPSKKRGFR